MVGYAPTLLYYYIGDGKMFIEEKIEIRIDPRTLKHYINKGYDVKSGEIATISSSDLSSGSRYMVLIKCDYCETEFRRQFKDYVTIKNREKKKKSIGTDSCNSCRPRKQLHISEMFFDGIHPSQRPEAVKRRKQTNIEKYGVENPFENEEIREKAKNKTMQLYGVDNYFKIDNFYDIQKESMLEKYGYEHYSEDKDKLEESNRKRAITMHKKGSAPSSRQQRYIHDVIGGELNYPFGSLMLDIAFPDRLMYLEYQGSGHDLDVKMEKLTEKEFKRRDINRYYFLKKKGWKMIEIISTSDNIPLPAVLKEMMRLSEEVLKSSSYIVFNLDDLTVKIKGKYKKYDFGNMITQSVFRRVHENGEYDNFLEKVRNINLD